MVASKGTNGDVPFPFDVDILLYCVLTASRCLFSIRTSVYGELPQATFEKQRGDHEVPDTLQPHGQSVDPRHVRLYLVVYDSVRCRIRSRHCGGFVFIGCACSVSLLDNFKAEG